MRNGAGRAGGVSDPAAIAPGLRENDARSTEPERCLRHNPSQQPGQRQRPEPISPHPYTSVHAATDAPEAGHRAGRFVRERPRKAVPERGRLSQGERQGFKPGGRKHGDIDPCGDVVPSGPVSSMPPSPGSGCVFLRPPLRIRLKPGRGDLRRNSPDQGSGAAPVGQWPPLTVVTADQRRTSTVTSHHSAWAGAPAACHAGVGQRAGPQWPAGLKVAA